MEKIKNPKLTIVDKWILSRLAKTIENSRSYMENYEISKAMLEAESFFVGEFCDYYLEFVKYRIYQEIDAIGARATLYTTLLGVIELFAPFLPYITDSIYFEIFAKAEGKASIHQTGYPKPPEIDKNALATGELLKKVISEIRKWKISNKLSLGKEIAKIEVYASKDELEQLKKVETDIMKIGRSAAISLSEGEFEVKCFA
jgi:valyl-tRNA synthetase